MNKLLWTTALCLVVTIVPRQSFGQEETKPFFPATNNAPSPTNAVARFAPSPPPGFGGDPTTITSPPPAISFSALGDPNTFVPPDTMGAVGLTNCVTMLNTQVRIQTKLGTNVATTTLSNFWSSAGSFVRIADPRIVYDVYRNRWIACAIVDPQRTTSRLFVGASKNANPAFTNWYFFSIDVDSSNVTWADQPNLGFNKDWIVVQMNMYSVTGNIPTASLILVMTKTNLYAGSLGTVRGFSGAVNSIGFSQVPAITYDTNVSTLYLVQNWAGHRTDIQPGKTNGYLSVWRLSGSLGSESITQLTNFPAATPWADAPTEIDPNNVNSAPQIDLPTVKIMNNDARMQSVVYRNNAIYCAHTIFLEYTNAAPRSSVQYWRLTTNGTVSLQGRVDDIAGINFYAFPSISVNRFGDFMLGYSCFATNRYPSACYSFSAVNENTIQLPYTLKEGLGPYYRSATANRWGDYSATVVDVNEADFWTIQEYAATPVGTGLNQGDGRSGTWWGKVTVTIPANDNFTNGVTLSGSQGATNGTNLRATQESGEPNHAGNTAVKSVWYRWTAPTNGNVVFDTKGSILDSILAVYTGTSVSSLTLVTNDHNSILGDASQVVFNATAGTTYRIAVDGFNGNQDSFVLNWNQPTAPLFTIQPKSQSIYQGNNVTFSAMAIGRPDPTFQWQFNGSSISGATSASYTINPVSTNNAGNYTVVASNSSGSVTSQVAVLTVLTSQATFASPIYTNNQFTVSVSQVTNLAYIIQANTNLSTTNWIPLATNTAPFTFTDTGASNYPMRFYRALYKP